MGGRVCAGWSGVKGVGKWDNCNSIINKYIKKSETLELKNTITEMKNLIESATAD